MYIESETKDSILVQYKLSDDTPKGKYHLFTIEAKINGFSHDDGFWVTDGDYRKFITELKSLNQSIVGNATLISANSESDFSLSFIGERRNRGYLLIRAHFHLNKPRTQQPSTDVLFEGGFYVEPAKLSEWLAEFEGILEARNG